MRRVPIRIKLGATLLVPVLALVVVAGLEMFAAANEVDEVHDQAEIATATLGPPSLLLNIELERNAVSTYLLGTEDSVALSVENKEEAFAETDAAIEDFRAMVEGNGGFVAEKYQPALDALDNLTALRKQVTDYQGERSIELNPFVREVFDGYTAIMDEIYDANAQVVPTISNARLRRGAELADTSAHQRDISAQFIRTLLRTVAEPPGDGVDTPAEINELATLLGTLRRNAETIQTKAEGPYKQMADELFAKEHIRKYPEIIQNVLDTGDVDITLVLETSTGDEAGGFGYTVFSKQVNDQLRADADDVRADADGRLRTYGILAALAIAAGPGHDVARVEVADPAAAGADPAGRPRWPRPACPTRCAASSTPRSARTSRYRRSNPSAVKTRDEVGDVAEALNTVQETALELAVEQAVLRRNIADSFVNLGRRNQNLLGRQLDFITELESNETDPDTLASLFRLDHLATRMRRNAESLLVLAGIDPPRRWSAPVRLNDVIRAALGEVEDYQRVSVAGVEPATVVGSAAADLAHLIAEFVENALTFSPPDQNVEIRGRHIDAGYTLAIIDNGFGMAPDDIERANRRLAGVGELHRGAVEVPGPLRRRQPRRPPRGHAAPRAVTRVGRDRPHPPGGRAGGGVRGRRHAHGPARRVGAPAGRGAQPQGPGRARRQRQRQRQQRERQRARPERRRPGRAARGGLRGGRGPARGRPSADADAQHRPGAARPRAASGPARPAGAGTTGQRLGAAGPPAERTASGLTKRAPRNPAATAAMPQGELLDALSQHTTHPPGPMGLSPAAPPLPPLPNRTPGSTDLGPLPGRRTPGGGPAPSGRPRRAAPPGEAAGVGGPAGTPLPTAGPGGPPAPSGGPFTPTTGPADPRSPFAPGTGPAADPRRAPLTPRPGGAPGPEAAASRPRRATPAWAAGSRRRPRRRRPRRPARRPGEPPNRRGRPSVGSPVPTGAHGAR